MTTANIYALTAGIILLLCLSIQIALRIKGNKKQQPNNFSINGYTGASCLLLALLFHASTPFLIGLLLLTMGGYQLDMSR